jgi:hypothetical protein
MGGDTVNPAAGLVDLQLETVGQPAALVVQQSFDVSACFHAALLEVQQLASSLLGVGERCRDGDKLLERQQRGADRHEHGALQRVAPSGRRFALMLCDVVVLVDQSRSRSSSSTQDSDERPPA